MDVVEQINNIIKSSIDFAQKSSDADSLSELMRITRNFLFILDADKAPDYKMALLAEYLEEVAAIVPSSQNSVLLNIIKEIKDKQQQESITNQIHDLIVQFFDPQEVNPHLVTFWLNCTCDMQQIKSMAALMLMLDTEQQQKILSYDRKFMNDPKFQQLRSCLPTE